MYAEPSRCNDEVESELLQLNKLAQHNATKLVLITRGLNNSVDNNFTLVFLTYYWVYEKADINVGFIAMCLSITSPKMTSI